MDDSSSLSSNSRFDQLIRDLQFFRDHSLEKDRRRRSAILAGQFLILAQQYKSGHPPDRRTLKGFFYLAAREQSA